MRTLSPAGRQAISELAERHGFSREAVTSMLESIARGHGTMAQFNHPEFGGSGQWMGGGMTMVSDMFNDALKDRVARLCSDLARLVASDPTLARAGTIRSQGERDVWWPADLGTPTSCGSQNDVRYAYFMGARRLAIEVNGRLTLYDTLDHEVGGFSQQQSHEGSLSFHSQHGLLDVGSLPVVSVDGRKT